MADANWCVCADSQVLRAVCLKSSKYTGFQGRIRMIAY